MPQLQVAGNTYLVRPPKSTPPQAYTTYTLIASAKSGYSFKHWQNASSVIISTDSIISLNLLANTTYIAVFGSAMQNNSVCVLDTALISNLNTSTMIATPTTQNTLTALGYTSILGYSNNTMDTIRVWATPSSGCWATFNDAGQLVALQNNGSLYLDIADIPVSLVKDKVLIACFQAV